MSRVAKRFSVDCIRVGRLALSAAESHHARAVMRLELGHDVEVFDAAGRSATARIVSLMPQVEVEVRAIFQAATRRLQVTVASAIPKGARADWLVEKLSEIGAARFIPLQTARSVVHPQGASKTQRWQRLAAEAAKQSRRNGTMEIAPLTPLAELLSHSKAGAAWHLSTAAQAKPLAKALAETGDGDELLLLIGPEGGWSEDEESLLRSRGSVAVALTQSILRIETAGLVAAGAVLSVCRE